MAEYRKTNLYWLQLKEDFFDDDKIEWLEEQENGKEYVLFYIKLCLKSLKYGGIIIRNLGDRLIPYDDKKLAEMTGTNIDTVKVAMVALKNLGLVKVLENGELYLQQVENLIGTRTIGAEKKSLQRKSRGGGQLSTITTITTTTKDTITNTNKNNNTNSSNRDTRVIAHCEDKSSSLAIHSSNKKFSSNTNKGEREKSGIDKSLVDNFTDEQMLSFSKEKRIPIATLASYKEKYILWIQSNPKKNKCWNRNMSATVKTWINNAISKGEIIPAPKPLTQEEVIEKQKRELIMMWGSEEQKKKYEDKQ